MKRTSIKLGFARYADGQLGDKAQVIINGMTGNAHFPDPFPSPQDLQQQLAEFGAAKANMNGSLMNTVLKNNARKALISSLKMLGHYVLQHADGDEVKLRSTGFDLTATGTGGARKVLAPPSGFRVTNGNLDGSMHLSCERVEGARAYLFQYTEAPLTGDSQWESETATVPTRLLEGLTPGKAYCFRIAVAGRNSNRLVYSQVIAKHVN